MRLMIDIALQGTYLNNNCTPKCTYKSTYIYNNKTWDNKR